MYIQQLTAPYVTALADAHGYFPGIDCVVSTVDALQSSRTMLLGVIEGLLGHSITQENYPLVISALALLDSEGARKLQAHLEGIYGAVPVSEAQNGEEKGE